MGTGKSTLASRLHKELGWALISSDTTRKLLAEGSSSEPQRDAFGEGLYSPAWNARVYQAMLDQASTLLAAGRSVILDATFAQRAYRHAAAQEATVHGANLVFLECHSPREVTLQRLAKRWQARLDQQPGVSSADSDARPELYDAQAEAWQPFHAEEEPVSEYLAISTASAPDLEQILNALSIVHAPDHE
jgi:hypothetical protein